MKIINYIKPVLTVFLLTILDQATKFFAIKNLQFKEDLTLINGILSLTYHENRGAAFGIFQGARLFFLIFAIIITVLICIYYVKLPKGGVYSWVRAFLLVVLAGAFGNSIDRLLKGYVVDFIKTDFMNFPIFNMADIFVVTGTICLGILMIFFVKEDVKEEKHGK